MWLGEKSRGMATDPVGVYSGIITENLAKAVTINNRHYLWSRVCVSNTLTRLLFFEMKRICPESPF